MTRKRGRGVLKAPKKETVRALTSPSLLVLFIEFFSQCDEQIEGNNFMYAEYKCILWACVIGWLLRHALAGSRADR